MERGSAPWLRSHSTTSPTGPIFEFQIQPAVLAPYSTSGSRLLHDDSVRPLHQRHKDGRAAVFRSPVTQVAFRDPTGPGTGASRKDLDLFGEDLVARLLERRPADRLDLVGGGLAHQVGGFAGEKDLDLVSRVRKCQSM